MDMNEILEWLSADWWNGLGVILAIVGVPSLFAGIRYVVRKVRHTDDEETKPISNEQIDAMFSTTTSATLKPPMPPKFRIDINESGASFVLTNIGGPARNISVFAEAVEGTYTNTWNNHLGRTDGKPWALSDIHFFNIELPKLREERQQGGTTFFDGHVEDGTAKPITPSNSPSSGTDALNPWRSLKPSTNIRGLRNPARQRFAKLVAQRFGLGTIQRNNEVPHRTGTRELNEEHGGTMRQTAYMHRYTFHASHHATSKGSRPSNESTETSKKSAIRETSRSVRGRLP